MLAADAVAEALSPAKTDAARAADDEARRRATTSLIRESIGTVRETRTLRGGETLRGVSETRRGDSARLVVSRNGTEGTFGGRGRALPRTLTRASAAALRFVGKAAAASLAVGALVALEHRSRSVAERRNARARRETRAKRIPRRGRAGARGAQALDPGEVEAAVGKVLDERLANLGGLVDFEATSATSEATRAAESEAEERADVIGTSAVETTVEATVEATANE